MKLVVASIHRVFIVIIRNTHTKGDDHMAKFPFQAHIRTEFGGTGFKRCKTFDEAVAKATNEKNPAPHIQIVERWVANTKGEIIKTI